MRLSSLLECKLGFVLPHIYKDIILCDNGKYKIELLNILCNDIGSNKINWKNTINETIRIIDLSNNTDYEFKVTNYQGGSLTLERNNCTYNIDYRNLRNGHVGEILTQNCNRKIIRYPLIKDDKSFNHYQDCLINPDDAYKYTTGTARVKLNLFCPYCNTYFSQAPYNYRLLGYTKCKCKPPHTYPERFIAAYLKVLKQRGLIAYYKIQVHFKAPSQDILIQIGEQNMNRKCYIYDFIVYLNDLSRVIIETHGIQHYEECDFVTQTLSEIQFNDLVKENLAKQINGFDDLSYIILDCRESSLQQLMSSLIKSNLLNLIEENILDVNWKSIHKLASKKIRVDIINLYEKNPQISIIELSQLFSLTGNSIVRILKDAGLYIKENIYQNASNYRNKAVKKLVQEVCDYYQNICKDPMNTQTIPEIAAKYKKGYTTVLRWLKDNNYYNERREKYLKGYNIAKAKEASWMRYFKCAQDFYKEYTHLNTNDNPIYHGMNLHKWLQHQKENKKKYLENPLLHYRIDMLNSIGMIW